MAARARRPATASSGSACKTPVPGAGGRAGGVRPARGAGRRAGRGAARARTRAARSWPRYSPAARHSHSRARRQRLWPHRPRGRGGPVVAAQPPGGGQGRRSASWSASRPPAAVPGQCAGCTGWSRCCAVCARRSASSCSRSARVRRRRSRAMHRSCSVCPLPGSVLPAAGAGAPHRHPQVAGASIPAASVTVKACPRAHRYAACWRDAGWVPGRSANPAPAPGVSRCCRGLIMNSPGRARHARGLPRGRPSRDGLCRSSCPPRGEAATGPCG
jgi:hypothetical protein